jgi:hypothetical protein
VNLAVQAVLGALLLWGNLQADCHNPLLPMVVQVQGLCFAVGVVRAVLCLKKVPPEWKPAVIRNAMVLGLSLLLSAPAAWVWGCWLLDSLRARS